LNVIILRYGVKDISKTRSGCLSCSHQLAPKDLVPIFSFIFLGGRCRYCKSSISLQYPLVEFLTGLIFLLLYSILGLSLGLLFSFLVSALFIIIFVYDLKHKIIPDAAVYSLILLSLCYMLYSNFENLTPLVLLSGVIVATPFAFLWFFSGGRWMGFGDAKLSLSIGWLLGLSGGISAITIAFWIGAITGLFLLLVSKIKNFGLSQKFKNLTIKSEIPFAPFLILGTAIVFFCGFSVFDLYLFF